MFAVLQSLAREKIVHLLWCYAAYVMHGMRPQFGPPICNLRGLALLPREMDDEPCRGTKNKCFRTAYPQEDLRPSEDGRRMANQIQQLVVPTIR